MIRKELVSQRVEANPELQRSADLITISFHRYDSSPMDERLPCSPPV